MGGIERKEREKEREKEKERKKKRGREGGVKRTKREKLLKNKIIKISEIK